MKKIGIYKKDVQMPETPGLGGKTSLSSLLRCFETLATQHSDSVNLNDDINKDFKNVGWIITGYRVNIESTPEPGQKIIARTWPGKGRLGMFPRYFSLSDSEDNLLVTASSQWAIMDLDRRAMLAASEHGLEIEPETKGDEPAAPKRFKKLSEVSQTFQRTVTEDAIDSNGHMNNVVYLDWIEDWAGDFLASGGSLADGSTMEGAEPGVDRPTKRISSINIMYSHELMLGDTADVNVEISESGARFMVLEGENVAFTAEIELV